MSTLYVSQKEAFEDAARFEPLLTMTTMERRLTALAQSAPVQREYKAKTKPYQFVQWASTDMGLGLGMVAAKRLAWLVDYELKQPKVPYITPVRGEHKWRPGISTVWLPWHHIIGINLFKHCWIIVLKEERS